MSTYLLILMAVDQTNAIPNVSQCSAVPPPLRIRCGKSSDPRVPITSELCAARGCCWDDSIVDAVPYPVKDACLTGTLSTPAKGVQGVGVWTQHVAFSNPAGWSVQVEIAGFVHHGQHGGPGPCCGNTFNLSVSNTSNIGFNVRVERTCPNLPNGHCTGKFVGWGQQLLLSWRSGQHPSNCKYPPLPGPSPSPPSPPPKCFYGEAGLPDAEISEVVIINADHLDVGYHGQIVDVVNRYFDIFWPRAMRIAQELRDLNRTETYVYTTFSWLVSLFYSCMPHAEGVHASLHCPNATYKAQVTAAIKRGELTWTAFPFNSEISAYDPAMVAFGITHTHQLDDMLGVPRKIVFPDRDVPGVSRSLIPILNRQGVKAINEAPNGAMYPTNVPPAFVWRDADSHAATNTTAVAGVSPPSGEETLVMWWQQDCDTFCMQKFPQSDLAVLFDWRGEDSGPNVGDAKAVLNLYSQARARFPHASIRGGTLDDVARSLLRPHVHDALPVLEVEVGDTWAYGIQSDPLKVAQLRAAMRHRSAYAREKGWVDATASAPGSPFDWFSNFSRLLLKGFEHTWGLRYDMCYGGGFDSALSIDGHDIDPVGTSDDPDNPFPYYDIPGGMANATGYLNPVFHAARDDPNGYPSRHCEPSWRDQTDWALGASAGALQDPVLARAIENETEMLSEATAPDPLGEGFFPVTDINKEISLGHLRVSICAASGAVCGLRDTLSGQQWASPAHPLALFTYSLYTNERMSDLRSEYCPHGCNAKEFGKPGMPLNNSVNATPTNPSVWVKPNPNGTDEAAQVLTRGWMDVSLNRDYGAPAEVWLRLSPGVSGVDMTLTLVNKTSTRFAEAAFLTFAPTQHPGGGWAIDKLGEWVSPLSVADGGSQGLSLVNSGMLYTCGSTCGMMFVRSLDAGVVKFGDLLPFPTPVHGGPDLRPGVHFLLHDNFWNTNYVFWWPYHTKSGVNQANLVYRFGVEFYTG